MATSQYAKSLLGGLQADLKRVLTDVFEQLIPNWRFGPISHQAKSENFQAYYADSTTAASTGEFSIVHGMGRTPYAALQFLRLDDTTARTVLLEVSRPADGQRVYLRAQAGSTNKPFTLLLE